MKAVFLDKDTFSIDLPAPPNISHFTTYGHTPQDDDVIVERCMDADIIITNKVVLTKAILMRLPNLKLIHITATGTNNVDLSACQTLGIKVFNVAGYSVVSVPEHTLMLMLTAMRAGLYYHRVTTDGTWQADGKFCLVNEPIFDLSGRTLGIIGAGTLGKQVGTIAKAFGMKVLYAERQNTPPRNEDYTAFDDVLAQADVISLHCALTDDTHHLINHQTLAKMQKRPLLINMARGAVVDAEAVAWALDEGLILGFASDVFEQEPPLTSDPLLALKNHPRVFFTPHNAWASVGAQTRLWQILCEQIEAFVGN